MEYSVWLFACDAIAEQFNFNNPNEMITHFISVNENNVCL